MENKKIFEKILRGKIGTTRVINDGGLESGEKFKLTAKNVSGIAELLSQWWSEEYGADKDGSGVELTLECAEEFLGEIYPEAGNYAG